MLQHHDEDADTERGEYSDLDDDADEDTPMMLGQTGGAVEAADAPLSNAPPKPLPLPLVKKPEKPPPIAWRDLPKKQQLFVITMTRLSEPLVQTSLQVCISLVSLKYPRRKVQNMA